MHKSQIFFSLFSYPLTATELWKYQWDSNFDLKYFFRRQEQNFFNSDLWRIRNRRWAISFGKLKKALRAAEFLKYAPFVRGIAISNTLSYQNARPFADIDLFVIYEWANGWAARFFCAFISLFFGRPQKNKTKKFPICLSFYLSADKLNINFLRIDEQDVYLYYWACQLFPVYGEEVWDKFWESNEAWVKKHLPCCYPRKIPSSYKVDLERRAGLKIKNLLEKIFSFKIIGSFLAAVEWAYLPQKIKALANKDTRVVAGDRILKFHIEDRRDFYLKKWKSLSGDYY